MKNLDKKAETFRKLELMRSKELSKEQMTKAHQMARNEKANSLVK
jgi:hypothetical protein